jgi:hypothetical protein
MIRIKFAALIGSLCVAGWSYAATAQDMSTMPGMDHTPAPQAPPPAAPAPTQTPPPTAAPPPTHTGDMTGMDMGGDKPGMAMMAGDLGGYSMMRDASGTSWQPDSTPMEAITGKSGDWTTMLHGYALAIYDHQGGPRGANMTFSENMLMGMAQRAVGPGTLTLRGMISLEPLMGGAGYPLLLQSGETANGVTPLIDRQHPHNLFMELAGIYSRPIGAGSSAFLYVGYPGEPALGPPTFMHRVSGMDDPAAPITHHWLDSTHITYGVITTGLVHGDWKLEASVFKGREPDQHRWGFNAPALDSYSGRISWNPTADWALQVSYGSLHSPEQLQPDVNQRRTTASATYNRNWAGGNWQTTAAWGRNNDTPGNTLDAFLAESAVTWGRHTVFGRAENVQKDELFLAPNPLAGRVFRVSEFTAGYIYDIPVAEHLALGFGALGTAYGLPSAIQPAYGGSPTSYMGFVRLKIR